MPAQLLQKIVDNTHMALLLHSELSTIMLFLGLRGYHMQHEYQIADESLMLRRVKKYIIETYGIYILDEVPESANLAEPLIGNKQRGKVSQAEILEILQKSWRAYESWEKSTIAKLSEIATALFDIKEINAYSFVASIIAEVQKELNILTGIILEFELHEWDMAQIVAEQAMLAEKYRKKLDKMKAGSELWKV